MKKTMVELFNEQGPQGWVDDPPSKDDPDAELIADLEDQLQEIDEEIETLDYEIEELEERRDELTSTGHELEKRIRALRG